MKMSAWGIAAALLAIAPSPAAAQLDSATRARGLVASVPFEYVGNRILIQVTIDSFAPLTYVFDTGAAGGPLMSARTAASLGIGGSDTVLGRGFSGQAPVVRARVHDIRVGPLQLDDVVGVGLVDMSHIERSEGRRIDGIIGGPLLSRYAVRIDFDSSRLEFYDNRRSTFEPAGLRPDVGFISGTIAVLDAATTLGDGSRLRGALILDTGSPGTALFNARFARRTGILDRVPALCETSAAGMSSRTVPIRQMMLRNLAFSGFESGPIPVSVAVPLPEDRFRPQSDGTVGLDLLGRFNIFIDVRHRRVVLEPNGRPWEQPRANCAGLGLATDSTFRRILVDRVYEGQPASHAGLEAGDEILGVGGRTASDLTLQGVRRVLKSEWVQLELVVSRGGETRTLTLRRNPTGTQ